MAVVVEVHVYTEVLVENERRSIENLPFELQRNFTLMRDLDQRTQGKTEWVDKHIRRLDADLARFEQELKERTLEQASPVEGREKSKILSFSLELTPISNREVPF
eukprot:XP_011677782.1 PREDICTED: inhibitor of growth protein 4-like [Strongylocentrotus purpuratus]